MCRPSGTECEASRGKTDSCGTPRLKEVITDENGDGGIWSRGIVLGEPQELRRNRERAQEHISGWFLAKARQYTLASTKLISNAQNVTKYIRCTKNTSFSFHKNVSGHKDLHVSSDHGSVCVKTAAGRPSTHVNDECVHVCLSPVSFSTLLGMFPVCLPRGALHLSTHSR